MLGRILFSRFGGLLTVSMLSMSLLSACGGGGGGDSPSSGSGAVSSLPSTPVTPAVPATPGAPSTPVDVVKPATRAEAVRFLRQATFGPGSDAEIDRLMSIGYNKWFDEQFAEARFNHLDWADSQGEWPLGIDMPATVFWTSATHGKDQLRMRMVWALSQIYALATDQPSYMRSYYWDILAEQAFLDYRALIDRLTFNRMMGENLTYWFNRGREGNKDLVPDQNYAREIMQLYSIGLWELNTDGTRKLSGGKPILTYSQDDIVGLSRVFTGIVSYGVNGTKPPSTRNYFGYKEWAYEWIVPGYVWDGPHSKQEKKFLGVTIPAQKAEEVTETTARADIKLALDTIAAHQNVGPFLSKQLIQRFVTSNPSPAYVERVAKVWNNNGQGVRGDFKAVLKSILMDPEARDPVKAKEPTFGKVREPVLLASQMFKILDLKSAKNNGVWMTITGNQECLVSYGIQTVTGSQDPLQSPTVFNFYRPGFAPAGSDIDKAGLVAPEFQILDTQSVTRWSAFVYDTLRFGGTGRTISVSPGDNTCLRPLSKYDFSRLTELAKDPKKLVDYLSLVLSADTISQARRDKLVEAVSKANGATKADTAEWDKWGVPYTKTATPPTQDDILKSRVRVAISLIMTMPEVIIQR